MPQAERLSETIDSLSRPSLPTCTRPLIHISRIQSTLTSLFYLLWSGADRLLPQLCIPPFPRSPHPRTPQHRLPRKITLARYLHALRRTYRCKSASDRRHTRMGLRRLRRFNECADKRAEGKGWREGMGYLEGRMSGRRVSPCCFSKC